MNRFLGRSIILMALCAPMAGCLTSAERLATRNNERCTNRGFQPNTKDFNDCLIQLDNEHDSRMQARRQEMLEKSAVPSSNRGY
jgi:hypothetical protein